MTTVDVAHLLNLFSFSQQNCYQTVNVVISGWLNAHLLNLFAFSQQNCYQTVSVVISGWLNVTYASRHNRSMLHALFFKQLQGDHADDAANTHTRAADTHTDTLGICTHKL